VTAHDPRTPAVVYLDYAATTPVDPLVVQAMVGCLAADGEFGNPASATHSYGKRAAARVEHARAQVSALIGAAPEEIVFTSGATESANLAILGSARANADRGRHIVASRIEHKAVLDPCKQLEKEGFSLTWLSPDRDGVISPQALRQVLRPDTVLVSLMHANNEIGVIQDLGAIGAACRERGVLLHSDAAQSVGKIDVDVQALAVDFLSFTAHKVYGPKGIGALYVRASRRGFLQPVIFGGGQERGLRPGTLPTHQIVGFGAACELAARQRVSEARHLEHLRERLWSRLSRLGGAHLNGAAAPRLPGILNVSFEGVEGESLVTGLPELALSTGSACNSASGDPSYVLRALGRDSQLAQSSLRFSFGRHTTEADIDLAGAAVAREVQRLRALSPREPPPEGFTVSGEAGGPGEGTWVRFDLAVDDGIVKAARFKSYGCPHTLAVASWLASQLPGRRRDALVPGTPAAWAAAQAVPVEKLGRLLVVEDALQQCVRRWE
jgi:cysteine desulfurase